MALTKVGKEGITGVDNSADANAITIDSSENVTLSGGLSMTSDDPTITMTDSSGTNDIGTIQSTSGALIFTARDGSADGEIIFKKFDGTTTDESMRIHSDGAVTFNQRVSINSSTKASSSYAMSVQIASGTGGVIVQKVSTALNYAFNFLKTGGASIGTITLSETATAYNTSSDHRLKENVDYTFDATTRLKQLKPARFNFIADADTTVDGFLAHEVSSVVPEAISGTHNEVDDDGNAVMQGIDQSKLVPLLVKTIQELEARITALENGE